MKNIENMEPEEAGKIVGEFLKGLENLKQKNRHQKRNKATGGLY
jgi:hypothetical protein